MIEFIEDFLTEYRTKKEILAELLKRGIEVNERTWRANKILHNERYFEGNTSKLLVHSSKGYKLTENDEAIIIMIKDLTSRSRKMEKQIRKLNYVLRHKNHKSIFNFIKKDTAETVPIN